VENGAGESTARSLQLTVENLFEYNVARTVARRAGASLLTASPTVPACRLAYAADLRAIERLAMGRTITASILCNIAHARHLSTGFVAAVDTTPARFDRWAAARGDAAH
jgi:hypothetical protein